MANSGDERVNSRAAARQLGFVARPKLDDYRAKYAPLFKLERHDGILEAQMHTRGGAASYGFTLHNAWSQLWLDIGNDPDNELLIFSGAADKWIGEFDASFPSPDEAAQTLQRMPADTFYDQIYSDATKLLEAFVFNIEIPTIACINGPGPHTEFALLCDITLCAEEAQLFDPHFPFGLVPGDGQGLTFQELMGPKRSAYYLYTGEAITANAAKDLGLVNEVLPRDRLLPRALEIAEQIMRQPRPVRRMTSGLIRRQWKRRLTQDLGFHIAHELLALRLYERAAAAAPQTGGPATKSGR